MDLGCCLDEVLEVGAGEEVAEVDEFAVFLVFDIDSSPAVLAATNSFAVDVDVVLTADNRKWDDRLVSVSKGLHKRVDDDVP